MYLAPPLFGLFALDANVCMCALLGYTRTRCCQCFPVQTAILHWVSTTRLVGLQTYSAIFSGGAGGARAPPEFGGSEKGRSLISAYRSLAITTNTPGFNKLSTALI